MNITESKKNVLIGVLTGVLTGFVLGALFGIPDADVKTGNGNAAGDVAKIANMGKFRATDKSLETASEGQGDGSAISRTDTLRYEAVGEDGKSMEIIIIK